MAVRPTQMTVPTKASAALPPLSSSHVPTLLQMSLSHATAPSFGAPRVSENDGADQAPGRTLERSSRSWAAGPAGRDTIVGGVAARLEERSSTDKRNHTRGQGSAAGNIYEKACDRQTAP